METKNLGLVKAIFKQSIPPTRTDVLWYDTINNVLNIYDIVGQRWLPRYSQLTGAVTDGAPSNSEITAIIGLSAAAAGAGYKTTIKDSTGTGILYMVESDGTNWFYLTLIKAL